MKSILLSIKPKYVAMILNGEKTIEVRKRFPKNYKGWVYIYCTKMDKKGLNQLLKDWKLEDNECWFIGKDMYKHNPNDIDFTKTNLNGKVVARFYCDKVEEITNYINLSNANGICFKTNSIDNDELCLKSLLMTDELDKYLYSNNRKGYAIYISQLEIFDEPKELSEFYTKHYPQFVNMVKNKTHYELTPLTKAPQSWCYVEVE